LNGVAVGDIDDDGTPGLPRVATAGRRLLDLMQPKLAAAGCQRDAGKRRRYRSAQTPVPST
jgi:hypothetical protein